MNKIQVKRLEQGYREKPEWPVCKNCMFYRCQKTTVDGAYGGEYVIEKDKHCSLAGFTVKLTATCDHHQHIAYARQH